MIVDKGTFKVLKKKGTLATDSLGSCIALAVLDPQAQIGGLWVFVLPARKILLKNNANGVSSLFFADEGLEPFLKALREQGADFNRAKFVIAGGARFLEAPTIFDLGGINIAMIRKLFKSTGINNYEEHVGGPFPRVVHLDLEQGIIEVKTPGKEAESW